MGYGVIQLSICGILIWQERLPLPSTASGKIQYVDIVDVFDGMNTP